MSKATFDSSLHKETSNSLSRWLTIIKKERLPLFHQISHNITPESIALEIGAGSAWLSSSLSQHKNINHITATEIDPRRLGLAKNYFSHRLNAVKNKISFRQSDFHDISFIEDGTLDIVFVDAALHHTDTLETLLQELYRILKDNGQIIAIREPILPSLPILKQFRKKTFGRKQIKNGDIEHTYSKNEWTTHFNKCNFNLKFYPLYGGSTKDKLLSNIFLSKFNGILFSRYYIVATKK